MKRLNKYITDAGYCSRREADNYISQGRVTINGREAVLGDMVGDMDLVEVDGEKVGKRKKSPVYIACNKPVGVTCTSERSDKTNIIDFLGYKERIFPVGRLDKDSEGLILLTNDGDIVNKILRAGNNNPKEYVVTVDKPITAEFLSHMAGGVNILGVTTKPCKIFRTKETTFVIHLTQGLNRQIRRMCHVLGYKVAKLKRVKVLNISLGNLETGRWRHLTTEEAREMHALLAQSSGTEEASDEKKAFRARPSQQKKPGSYSQYRRGGKVHGTTEDRGYGITPIAADSRPQRDPEGKTARATATKTHRVAVAKPHATTSGKSRHAMDGKERGAAEGRPQQSPASKTSRASTTKTHRTVDGGRPSGNRKSPKNPSTRPSSPKKGK